MVVRLNLLELEVDPAVLDQGLYGGASGVPESLLLLVERSLDVVLDLLSLVLASVESLVGVGRESGSTSLSLVLQRVGSVFSSSESLVLVGRDGGLSGWMCVTTG